MPRYGGGYGSNYRPAFVDQGAEDPLMAAIASALGGWAGTKLRKKEEDEYNAEKLRKRTLEDEDRKARTDRFEYEKEQDALTRQEREDARRQAAVQRQDDLGVRFTGNMNFPLVKTGPSKMERESTLKEQVREVHERPDLIAQADQFGIPNASQLQNPQLRAMIDEAKRKASIKDYETKQSIDARYRAPPDPSIAEGRRSIIGAREEQEARRATGDKRALTEKYIEAAGGDANRAWRMMSETDAQAMGDFKMRPPDMLSAAQRYRDRRNPPVRPSSGTVRDDLMAMALGDEEPAAPTSGAAPGVRRQATDDDINAALRAVGPDEQKVRAWLISKGINPDG